jgi:SOS-response transcriptional repressor LexA
MEAMAFPKTQRKATPEAVIYALQKFVAEHGKPPTVRELRWILKVESTRTVLRYLQDLEERGIIKRRPGPRGIRLAQSPPGTGPADES